jgi:hypothetical protein
LLKKKSDISESDAQEIAKKLVYEYKDHGFVIDAEEAQSQLGSSLVITDSREARFGEDVYQLLTSLNFMLDIMKQRRVLVVGSLTSGYFLWKKRK